MKFDPTQRDIDIAFVQEILLEHEIEENIKYPPNGSIGFETSSRVVFPAFQFSSRAPYRLYSVFVQLLPKLGAREDSLTALKWWLTDNEHLGRKPADLLGTPDEYKIVRAVEHFKKA